VLQGTRGIPNFLFHGFPWNKQGDLPHASEEYKIPSGLTDAYQQEPRPQLVHHISVDMRTSAILYPVVALAALVAAIPEPVIARGGSSCSNGTLSCCNNTYKVCLRVFARYIVLLQWVRMTHFAYVG